MTEHTDLAGVVQRIDSARTHAPFVVGIEGRGGAGKSTLAAHLAAHIPDSAVIPMDDFLVREHLLDPLNERHYDLARLEREVLIPFTQGLPVNYRRLEWASNTLMPIDGMIGSTLVILEGVCAYHPRHESYVNLRVWVETPAEVATARGRERDAGNENAQHWQTWQSADDTYVRDVGPQRRADVSIAGS